MAKFLVIMTVLALAVGRVLIEPRLDLPTATGSYEAVAHLIVGGFYGAWWVSKKPWHPIDGGCWGDWYELRDKGLFWSATLISLFEMAMFLWQKNQ
jgi:hypothetical protein